MLRIVLVRLFLGAAALKCDEDSAEGIVPVMMGYNNIRQQNARSAAQSAAAAKKRQEEAAAKRLFNACHTQAVASGEACSEPCSGGTTPYRTEDAACIALFQQEYQTDFHPHPCNEDLCAEDIWKVQQDATARWGRVDPAQPILLARTTGALPLERGWRCQVEVRDSAGAVVHRLALGEDLAPREQTAPAGKIAPGMALAWRGCEFATASGAYPGLRAEAQAAGADSVDVTRIPFDLQLNVVDGEPNEVDEKTVKALYVLPTLAVLQWSEPDQRGRPVTSYAVEYECWEDEYTGSELRVASTVLVETRVEDGVVNATVEQLPADSYCAIRVRARSSLGESATKQLVLGTPKKGCASTLLSPRKCCKGAGQFDYYCVTKNLFSNTCTAKGMETATDGNFCGERMELDADGNGAPDREWSWCKQRGRPPSWC